MLNSVLDNDFDNDLFLSLKDKTSVLTAVRDDQYPLEFLGSRYHNKSMMSNIARLNSFGSEAQAIFFSKIKDFDVMNFVKAGFYYRGSSDEVVCHYCGLGLKDFEWTDNVYLEHVKHKPDCQYLINQVGVSLIAKYHKFARITCCENGF